MGVSREWLPGSVYKRNDSLICGTHPWEPSCVCCFLFAGRRPRDTEVKHRGSRVDGRNQPGHRLCFHSPEDISDLATRPSRRYCLAEVEMAVQDKKGEKSNTIQVTHSYILMFYLSFPLFSIFKVAWFLHSWPRRIKRCFFFREEKKMKPVWEERGRICKSKENVTTEKSSILICPVCYNKELWTAWLT